MSIDLSRQPTDFRKRYAGVRMQQGRVLTDDDFNEAALIAEEELRRTRLDAIGPFGSPDEGFKVKPGSLQFINNLPTFKLMPGTLYLGGLRVQLDAEVDFHQQPDWLNYLPSDTTALVAPGNKTVVWIEAWQQPVSAVEDSELFEVALGGADTTQRWRTLWRVNYYPTNVVDCTTGWEALKIALLFSGQGLVGSDMALFTDARLNVTYTTPPVNNNLCAPPVAGGYLGAENQAIRVQMVNATTFTWGFDNAAPLYRVQASSKAGQKVVLKLLTPPKDAQHWPLQNQVVEVLPWSAALPNGEVVAELSGHLSKVAVSYNPDDQTLELSTALPANFGEAWKTRSDKSSFNNAADPKDEYFFLRVWNRGDDLTSAAAITVNAAGNVLGNTGLQVRLTGQCRKHDYWIIAARPEAPNRVTPWALEQVNGTPPLGMKRYVAPLALLNWTTNPQQGSIVSDCRPPFLPLTKIRNCCTITVGDGSNSFGHYTSIQAAINALPPSGGTVCVLPGEYRENLVINNRDNITLQGCGVRSRVIAGNVNNNPAPALRIIDSDDIQVEALALEAGPAAVIDANNCQRLQLRNNLVQMRDNQQVATDVAIFVQGDDLRIEGNVVNIKPRQATIFGGGTIALADAARGGIQIGGASRRVQIVDNLISGGIGNGITLGSLLMQVNGVITPVHDIELIDICAPCAPSSSTSTGGVTAGGVTVTYVSAGDVYEIEIIDNDIFRQGANGISVVRFFLEQNNQTEMIAAHRLTLRGNRIVQCLRRDVTTPPTGMELAVAYGGITLAYVSHLVIESNDIIRNGKNWLAPVCGVFALMAEGLRIEHNRILYNGPKNSDALANAQAGLRAGVHIWLVFDQDQQIRVQDNQIIQPHGRALTLLGVGGMSVCDNQLVTQTAGSAVTDPLVGSVLLGNFGLSREWTLGLIYVLIIKTLGTKTTNTQLCQYAEYAKFSEPLDVFLPSGKTLFANNQVALEDLEAGGSFHLCNALLLSLDDLAISDNQIECHLPARVVLFNVLAAATTLRLQGNRASEIWGRAVLSGLGLGLMSSVTHNQSTHCMRALAVQPLEELNQALAQLFCVEACEEDIFNNLGAALALGLIGI